MFARQPALSNQPARIANWRLAAPASALVVSVDDVKTFVGRVIEDTYWDDEYSRFIKVATAEIERVCRIDLTPKTWIGTLPQFWDRIALNKRPFVDVTSIQYVAADTGEVLVVPAGVYHVIPAPQMTGMAFLGDGLEWPDAARRLDAVRMTVRSGFAVTDQDVADGYLVLPDEIRHAVMMTIASLETKRGDDAGQSGSNTTVYAMKNARGGTLIPPEAKTLLADYVLRWITV